MTDEFFVSSLMDMRESLYRVSYSLLGSEQDRNDAMQECLLKAWEKRHTLRQPEYLKTWITRILINECHSLGRRLQKTFPAEDAMALAGGFTAPPDADVELHDALVSLPEKIRLPIILYYIEGYGVREIAQILRTPQGTVSSRLRAGRQTLKDKLGEEVTQRA